jgi:hypothetical protein
MQPTRVLIALAVLGTAFLATGDRLPPSATNETSVAIYDVNPGHLWNRLYQVLLVREDRHGTKYGVDSLDPLLWWESEQLLAEPSHTRALRVLDEFLQSHAENLIHDPVKRVMLQRDLWAVFDWSVQQYSANGRPRYEREKREVQSRLAEVLRRLALTPKEIEKLPSNYLDAVKSGAFAREYDSSQRELPFLPPDLLDLNGPWVGITPDADPVAPSHVDAFSGRSSFSVLMRLPGGRKATFDYFQSLWNFPQPWVQRTDIPDANNQTVINPDLPSFPAGTQVALVRQMTTFDTQGNLTVVPITESIQIRVYPEITKHDRDDHPTDPTRPAASGQDFYEFRLSRPLLFAGKSGGLRAVGRDEKEFSTFQTQGFDEIEEFTDRNDVIQHWPPVLNFCPECHFGGGVRSLNSVPSLLRPRSRQQEPANAVYGARYWEDSSVLSWKQNRYDWGLLHGYWKTVASKR